MIGQGLVAWNANRERYMATYIVVRHADINGVLKIECPVWQNGRELVVGIIQGQS